MFNVLPDILKEEIKTEYRLRWLIVLCLSFLFVQISFLIFLFPSWVISLYQEKEASDKVNLQNSLSVSKNTNVLLQTINETNKKLSVVNTSFQYSNVVPIFKNIISFKTNYISLHQLSYVSTGTSTATLSVGGMSANREALVSFVKNLQNSGLFTNVNSPVSNLEKNKNIDFVINLNSSI